MSTILAEESHAAAASFLACHVTAEGALAQSSRGGFGPAPPIHSGAGNPSGLGQEPDFGVLSEIEGVAVPSLYGIGGLRRPTTLSGAVTGHKVISSVRVKRPGPDPVTCRSQSEIKRAGQALWPSPGQA
jgi:hypothetical protein